MTQRFFIVGCQRTGTTLLRLILECHSRIACFDETTAYRMLTEGVEPPSERDLLGFKIPRWTEQLQAPSLWEYGLDGPVPQFYRQEPLLFLLRDPRDTVASMATLKAGRESWLEAWAMPILDSKLQSLQFRQRFARDIALLHASRHPRFAYGALYWKYKTQAFLDYRAAGWPALGVAYEDLVNTPEPHLQAIVRFLGMPWEAGVLQHPQFWHREVFPDGRTVGTTDPRRPIDPSSVGQWQRLFSAEEAHSIMEIAGALYREIQHGEHP